MIWCEKVIPCDSADLSISLCPAADFGTFAAFKSQFSSFGIWGLFVLAPSWDWDETWNSRVLYRM